MSKIFATQEQLDRTLQYWQHILLLDAWTICASISRQADMTLDNACGDIVYNHTNRTAVIHLIDPIDYGDDRVLDQDHEKTLVHELLHCVFSLLDDHDATDPIRGNITHQIINDLSCALLANTTRDKVDVG